MASNPARRWRIIGTHPRKKTPSRFRFVKTANNSGFALIAVIWSLGLVSLLGAAVIVGARYRIKVASNQAATVTAAVAAESAVNLAIALSLTNTPQQSVKFPLHCEMPNGEQSSIRIEEETGKVDLNAADGEVLSHLFTALTSDQSAGMRIATTILQFRDQVPAEMKTASNQSNGKSGADDRSRFTTIMQLDQIEGISPVVFKAALRFVTVSSGRQDPDADAASPALRKILGLDQAKPMPPRAPPASGAVTILADVSGTDGSRFIREALVSFAPEDGRLFHIIEWRHGDIDEGPMTGYAFKGSSSTQGKCFPIM